jgi:hypothetical protein
VFDCIVDCAGIPGGTAVEDECGVCGGDNSSCADCAGVINGNSVLDNCNICDSDLSNDCVPDCAGTWGGSSVDDECGVCGGNNSTCADCAGVANGSASVDECDTCDDDSSNDCEQDCEGQWGGSAEQDACDIHNKPFIEINPLEKLQQTQVNFDHWIKENGIYTLNVAGPRESEEPIYNKACSILIDVLFKYKF